MTNPIRPGTQEFDRCACLIAGGQFMRSINRQLYGARIAKLRRRYPREATLWITTMAAMTLGEGIEGL